MKKFKIGDRVRIRSWESMEKEFGLTGDGSIDCRGYFVHSMRHLCGRTATIIGLDDENVILRQWSNDKDINWSFSTDMLEPASFEKCDLQNGDILTDREGYISVYQDGELYGETIEFDGLENDLTANCKFYNEKDDIVKVERPIKFETVFERKEEEVKEMTMEELCEHFGCQIKIVKEEE